jgi:hypothetical protein
LLKAAPTSVILVLLWLDPKHPRCCARGGRPTSHLMGQ